MRLTAHDVTDGSLLWEHTASPGGAPAAPFFGSVNAAARAYPLPTVAPLVVDAGDDGTPAVVFFERDTSESTYIGDDFLRVADLRSGELREVTVPGVEHDPFSRSPLQVSADGDVIANVLTDAWACGSAVCFVTDDDISDAYGWIELDPETLEVRYAGGLIPAVEDTRVPEWGFGFSQVLGDDTIIARSVDGVDVWGHTPEELFGVERTSPPDEVPFTRVGDLLLIQGYQPLLETLERGKPHTLSIDYAASRTLVAVEVESGEVVWRLPGGDVLCHAVRERPIAEDAATIPICVATGGGYEYDVEEDRYLRDEPFEVAIAALDPATGELGWSVEGAGNVSIGHVVRRMSTTYAARGDLVVVEPDSTEGASLLDLRSGDTVPIDGDEPVFVCKSERDDVDLEFEGSIFAGGGNALTTGYPAGWYHFPCDFEGVEADTWSRGSVRVAGYPAGENLVVLPLDGSLAGFRLG